MTAIALANIYRGNLTQDADLQKQVAQSRAAGRCLEVELTDSDRQKARIHAVTQCGTAVGIVKKRDWLLTEGDVFATAQKQLIIVHLEASKLMVLSFANEPTGYALALIHLGHVLGNHHYPILVAPDRIYIQLTTDHTRLEDTIHRLGIPGLMVSYEMRSPTQLEFINPHNH